MSKLEGKTALVTGAAKRIGRAISIDLAKHGANVIIHYAKSEEEARKLQKEIAQLGVKSWLVNADFKDPRTCIEFIKRAYDESGTIEILINNASFFSVNPMETVKLEEINITNTVNTWAPFLLSREFANRSENGKIVNILDTRIMGYDFNHFAYYLSKKMLEILTESMALKLAPKITVNGIAPGLILPPEGKDYNYLEQKKGMVPLKKYGSLSDIVETVLFLLNSEFVTGQVIFVDGGAHLIKPVEGL